jgi:predicted RNase H-like HicB family nuclease
MKYLVVVEQTESGFSAYAPDVPGCVATAANRDEVEGEITRAIAFHLEGMRAEGLEPPTPHASSAYVDIPA